MKRILLFMLLTASMQLSAAERSREEMQNIAARQLWTSAGVKAKNGQLDVQGIRCIYENDAMAVYEPKEAGAFVIVSKSDLTAPVIGYSQTDFSLQYTSPALKWFLNTASKTIHTAETEGTIQKTGLHRASYQPVEPFITTLWDQGEPYNLKIKYGYPTGCVATAMAQCINYCRYPASAQFKGYAYYRDPSSSKWTIDSINVKSMYFYPFLDTYGRASQGQQNAVATLMRDCGYATYMWYDKEGSGTSAFFAGCAFVESFRYPEECVKFHHADFCSTEEWYNIIYSELQKKSPIFYAAQDVSGDGGHAFLLCGLDNDGLVYVNWGWSGSGNGFYDLSLLNPDDDGGFTDYQQMVYGIRSTPLEDDHVVTRMFSYSGNPYTFRFGMEKDDNGQEHQTLYADLPYGFINYNASSFNGVFGLFAEDLTDGTSWVIAEELQDPAELPSLAGYYGDSKAYEEFYFYYFIDGEQGLKPGHDYRISFGCRDECEGVWHSILCEGGELGYDIHYTGDVATSTIDEERKPVPVLDAINNVTADRSAESSNMTMVYDAMGRLVYSAPTMSFNLWDVPARGVLVVKQGRRVRKVVR